MPCLGPALRLGLIFVFDGGLAVLRRLQGRLVTLLLVGQFFGQTITLLDQGIELALLGAKGGLGHAQLLPQVGIGSCQYEEEEITKEVGKKDPTRLLSSRPESQGLQPTGAPARPREERRKRLTPAFGEMSHLRLQLPNLGVVGGRMKVMIILQKKQQSKNQ